MNFYTQDELEELTGFVNHPAQSRQLNKMGIIHETRADGMPMVLKSHIVKKFGGVDTKQAVRAEPKWENVNASQT